MDDETKAWEYDEAAAQAEAERRVRELAAKGGDTLDLSRLGALTALPDLSALTALTSLDVSGTRVSDLSPLSALTALTSLAVSRTRVSDLSPLSALTALTSLDVSDTPVSDLSPLSTLTALTSLDVGYTPVSDLSVLLQLPLFAGETAEGLRINSVPAADPKLDLRLSGMSNLGPKECAVEVVRYLKGQDDGPGTVPKPPLPERLAQASPVQVVVQEGRLAAVNAGAPERDKPGERAMRVRALRGHLDLLQAAAATQQVSQTFLRSLAAYAGALAEEEPTYLLLDGPMAFIRGGLTDPHTIKELDAAFVAGWRHLCQLHDDLRPLLLPPEEPDQPQPAPDVTPEAAIEVADTVIEALEQSPDIDRSVFDALGAAKWLLEAAKQGGRQAFRYLRSGLTVIANFVATLGELSKAATAIALFLATPQGQVLIQKIRPLWDIVSKMFVP